MSSTTPLRPEFISNLPQGHVTSTWFCSCVPVAITRNVISLRIISDEVGQNKIQSHQLRRDVYTLLCYINHFFLHVSIHGKNIITQALV